MALYLLVALQNSAPAFQTALSSKIEAANFYTIDDGKWIIESAATTSKDFSESLGAVATESTFIGVPVTGYFGRAQPDLLEWLAAKLTAKSLAAV